MPRYAYTEILALVISSVGMKSSDTVTFTPFLKTHGSESQGVKSKATIFDSFDPQSVKLTALLMSRVFAYETVKALLRQISSANLNVSRFIILN